MITKRHTSKIFLTFAVILLFVSFFIFFGKDFIFASPDPIISNVSPVEQRIGQAIIISGSGFGATGGYVKIAGFKVPASSINSWSDTSISLKIPQGSSSGNIQVVNSLGEISNSRSYTIDYWSDISGSFKASNPDEFTVLDIGGIGVGNKIEGEPGWMYHVVGSGLATYNLSYSPPRLTSIFYLPNKTATLRVFEDYIFVVGGYGLRIYKTSDLKNGFSGDSPRLVAAYTNDIVFLDVDVKRYSGNPINGVLVATLNPTDEKYIHFFEWQPNTETLKLIYKYHDNTSLASQANANSITLDPLNPKLYVSSKNGLQRQAYIHEFNITNLSNNNVQALTPFDLNTSRVPSDMEIYQNELWFAAFGTNNDYPNRNYRIFHTHSDTTLTEYGHIDTCSNEPEGVGHPECSVDNNCNLITMRHACPKGACKCINNICQDCTTGSFQSEIDLIEETGLVVGTTGQSTDTPYNHNIYLMNSDTAQTTHQPLASTESNDWSYDIAAIPGKILISDEWTNAMVANYSGSGSNYSIPHHREPSWTDSNRIFGSGLVHTSQVPWTYDGRVYGGEHLVSLDKSDLNDFSSWRNFQGDLNNAWWPMNGVHNGNYIFAKGIIENFVVGWAGTNLFLIQENPTTRKMTLLNNPEDNWYQSDSIAAQYGQPLNGSSIWLNNSMVVTSMANYGVYIFNVDTNQGTITENMHIGPGERFNGRAETYTSIAHIKDDLYGVGKSWVFWGGVPEDDWGGIRFYNIKSSPASITESSPGALNCLYKHGVYSIKTKNINNELWILAIVQDGSNMNILNPIYNKVVAFKYDEIDNLNSTCLTPWENGYDSNACNTQFNSLTLLDSFYEPQPSSGNADKNVVFWKDNLIAVSVYKKDSPEKVNTGIWVFELSENSNGTPRFAQKYFYPGYFSAHISTQSEAYTNFSDVNTYLLPNPANLVSDGNDLFVINQAGSWAKLGSPGSVVSCSDSDGDGYGANCPAGTDCDDSNASIHPGAVDTCSDGVDQNCSGSDSVCSNCTISVNIISRCLCGGAVRTSGYCCASGYQATVCIVDDEPPRGSVAINNYDQYTKSQNIILSILANDDSGVDEVGISNNSDFSTAVVSAYAVIKNWILSPTDGLKTVYIWFKDMVENWSASFNDTITLDTTFPTISSVSVSKNTTSATITWSTYEATKHELKYGLSTSYGQTETLPTYATDHSVSLSNLSDNTTYHYQIIVTDRAGNITQSLDRTFITDQAIVPDTTPPSAINNLASNSITQTSVDLSWRAPGDDGNIGTAQGYDLRYSTSVITSSDWDNATRLTGEPDPSNSGALEEYTVIGLSPETAYYFAIKASDEVPNWSNISNVVFITTLAPDPIDCNSFTYSAWDECQEDSTQTRTIETRLPTGCDGGSPVLSRGCAYIPPTCIDFTYSAWDDCQEGNTQTRTIETRTPGGCIGGISILSQDCIYTPPPGVTCRSFTYSTWDDCQEGNTQTRTIETRIPTDCVGGNPSLSQDCVYTPPTCISFTYSSWGPCQGDNQKRRGVDTRTPEGCVDGNPVLSESCTNQGDDPGGTPNTYIDSTPPSKPTEFKAKAGDGQVLLSWKNPSDSDFVRVLVVRKIGSSPKSIADGTLVYEGKAENYTDINLDNNITYYYSIFAHDKKPNYTSAVIVSAKTIVGKDSVEGSDKEETQTELKPAETTSNQTNKSKLEILRDYFGGSRDSDNDGIPDDKEINIYKTDPKKADTDGDGYSDGEEVYNFYSPLVKGDSIDRDFANRLKGRILLQPQEHGEAWYIYPKDQKRYYLGRPLDAFNIMRYLGLGITDANLARVPKNTDTWTDNSGMANRLLGTIVLQVEQNGEAWYINPVDKKRYYLGRPKDAFSIMRTLGLGITFNDLVKIEK